MRFSLLTCCLMKKDDLHRGIAQSKKRSSLLKKSSVAEYILQSGFSLTLRFCGLERNNELLWDFFNKLGRFSDKSFHGNHIHDVPLGDQCSLCLHIAYMDQRFGLQDVKHPRR